MNKTVIKQYSHSFCSLILLAIISLIFFDTANSYIIKWSKFDESLGHGFLIFALVIFEIIKLSKSYNLQPEKKHHILLVGIVFLAICHEISTFWGILIFQQFSFYLIWLMTIAYVLGVRYVKHISFPLAFLLFAVPFWEFSNSFFVDLTTQVTTFFLSFSDLTVYIYNNFIETPFGLIEVAEGCSGIRYFQIGFALAVYSIHGERLPFRIKLLVIFAGIALGIITNWIRVLGLIYIGYWSEMQSPLMKEHDNYGLLLFFCVISGVILLLNYLKKHFEYDKKEITHPQSTLQVSFRAITFSSIFAIFFIFSSSSLINQRFEFEPLPLKPLISPYDNLLINQGSFSEEALEIDFLDTKCQLVTRRFNYSAVGENVVPYGTLYNEKNYRVMNRDEFDIKINAENLTAHFIKLKQKQSREVKKLYYWYQFNSYTTINKYITKLLEINYLLKSNNKIALNVVICG